jgi:hypothetical protein
MYEVEYTSVFVYVFSFLIFLFLCLLFITFLIPFSLAVLTFPFSFSFHTSFFLCLFLSPLLVVIAAYAVDQGLATCGLKDSGGPSNLSLRPVT